MPDPLSLISGGSQLLGGLVSGLFGASQRRKGQHILKNNKYPDYEIPQEAIQAASEGLPSAQYSKAMKNIQDQQVAAIDASQDRRSALSTIAKTQALTNDAIGSLDAQNAMARMQNQRILGNYREKAWDWNKKNKYEQQQAYGMGLLGAGNQNIVNGIDRGIAGAGALGYGLFGDEDNNNSSGYGRRVGGGAGAGYYG